MISSKFSGSIFILILFGLLIGPEFKSIDLGTTAVQAQAAPQDVRQAYTLLNQGDVRGAISTFEKALQRYPQSWEAKLGLAIAYRRQGLLEKAWGAYNRVIEQIPNNELALRTIGELGEFRPEWQEKGIEALSYLLELNPNDLGARAQRALLFSYRGKLNLAQKDYEIVLQNDPTPENIIDAAKVYAYNGNYQEALELFQQYRASGGTITGAAAIAYARSLRDANNPASAIQVLETQLNSSSLTSEQRMQARGELAIAYVMTQQLNKAITALEPLRGSEDKQAKLILARSLHEIAKLTNDGSYSQKAAVLYQQALAQTPNPDSEMLREAADVLSSIPGYQQFALQLYQSLADREPNNRLWSIQQLALESQLGTIDPSQLQFRLQTTLYPLPTDPIAQKQLAQALIRFDSPNPQLLPVYQTLVQTVNDEPFLHFRIAQMYLQNNDLITARQALANYAATPQGAGDGASELLLAEIERREGNLVASAQRYNNLLASKPEPEIGQAALRGLAGVYISQNRLDDALAIYDQLATIIPQDYKTRLAQASLAYQIGRISEPEAEAILQQWFATQPTTNLPPELISLAVALPANIQREAFYQRLLEVDPNNTNLQLRYIQTIAQRSPGQAKLLLERLIARDPNNVGTYFVQGEFARGIGDLELAVNAYQNILAQQPDNVDALSALGGVRFQQRQLDKARSLYTQALDFRPEAFPVRRSLASLTVVQDRPLAALEQLEKLQVSQLASGTPSSALENQIQKLHQDFLRRRGFQPPWERYGFED